MNELQIFQNPDFGEVRTTVIDGEPWFVGKDVADILRYRNGSRDINRHVDEEDRQNYQNGTFESPRGMTIINASGLYSLVLSSKLPTAKKFKRWVTSEVLPAIRKHGDYQVPQKAMTEPDKTKVMRAEAMLRNSISKQAKMMLEIAKASHIQAYREVMMAKAGNILAGENILSMPQSGRERHSLGWFCEQIGKPKTWANQLGKILKIKGITKCPGENGEFVEDHAKGNRQKQVQNFEWYVDYLLPIVQRGAEKHWLVD